MTGIQIFADIEQRSDAWYELRRGMLTASAVAALVTPTLKVARNDTSRGLIATLAAERITQHSDANFTNADMLRGIDSEPYARAKYAEHKGVTVSEVGFVVRNFDGFRIGWSPDGLVGADGAIEIKAPRQRGHLTTILEDSVPGNYVPQIQCALLVSGRAWCDYVSYNGGMPLYIKRVEPDDRWHAAILAAAEEAEDAIRQMVERFTEVTADLPMTERIDFTELVI